MVFASVALIMVLVAAFSVALPLFRSSGLSEDEATAGQAAVYRDQLREIDRERGEGLLSDQQYEASRAEIGRRLLAADEAKSNYSAQQGGQRFMRWGAIGAVVVLMIAAAGTYPLFGTPGAPDQPLASRLNAEEPDLAVLVARVEQHLAENPDDGRGWELIAPIYLRENRYQDAQNAYANALRVSGPSVERLSGLGEAIVSVNSGIVTDEALAVFQQVEALQQDNLQALYFTGLAAEQSGKAAQAIARFEHLLTVLPVNSPWQEVVAGHIALNKEKLAEKGVVTNGPDDVAVTEAQELSVEARADMISGMVSGLEQKLKQDPDDIDGWMRLIRSYVVLDERDKAGLALDEALSYYGETSDAGTQLRAFGHSLQISGVRP